MNYEYNINKNTTVSLSTIKRIKRTLLEVVQDDNESTWTKLGERLPVQVDESVIIKGRLIKSPSEMYDLKGKATWIVGVIEEETRNIVLKILPNRKKETFLSFFQQNIYKNDTIKQMVIVHMQ